MSFTTNILLLISVITQWNKDWVTICSKSEVRSSHKSQENFCEVHSISRNFLRCFTWFLDRTGPNSIRVPVTWTNFECSIQVKKIENLEKWKFVTFWKFTFPKKNWNFFGENDVLGNILQCSPPREARLRLGSVAVALVDSPQQLYPSYVYKNIEKLDTDKRAYGWLPPMASSSGGQIGALCAERLCERILVEANDVCHDGNTLLNTEEINMLVVLRMNREFIQHMREI